VKEGVNANESRKKRTEGQHLNRLGRALSRAQGEDGRSTTPGLYRLQRVIAEAGIASRRAAEKLILAGRVKVNDRVVTVLGTKVDPARDRVSVDGRVLPSWGEPLRYIMLHKPYGYLSTFTDPAGRPTLSRLIQVPERVYSVGRLDMDSEGLLLLTNDGRLAHRLTHPRYQHPKEYLVQVEGVPTEAALAALRRGVEVKGRLTAPADVTLLTEPPAYLPARAVRPSVPTAWLRIVLREGRKRQIRHMTAAVGFPTLRLVRVGLGPLRLGDLPPGQWRDLTSEEVAALRHLTAKLARDTRP
jgi:pseudouridine synthase